MSERVDLHCTFRVLAYHWALTEDGRHVRIVDEAELLYADLCRCEDKSPIYIWPEDKLTLELIGPRRPN